MSSTTWPLAFEVLLRRRLWTLAPDQDIPAGSLVELGLDSLNSVALLVDLEREFGIDFSDDVLDPVLFAGADHLWAVIRRLMTEPPLTRTDSERSVP